MSQDRHAQNALSPWWRHGAILVMIFGFSILIYMTVRAYHGAPPVPNRIVDRLGRTIYTGDEVRRGQATFLRLGLMEHGSIWGHGAYLGPDYSAEYLHRETDIARDHVAHARFGKPFDALEPSLRATVSREVRTSLKHNRYDPRTGRLVLTPAQVESFRKQVGVWRSYFNKGRAPGLTPSFVPDQDIRPLTAFFAWAAWASVTARPGKDYSYTNNFPYDPDAGNRPPGQAYLWSAVSLVCLLGGLGLVLFLFGRFDFLGWRSGGEAPPRHVQHPQAPGLTGSQRAVGAFFAVVMLLFLLQGLLGGVLAHYRVEPNGFYGIDLAHLLPYNLARTWHLQLAIFWIATAWVGGGLLLAPMVGGREPAGQRLGAWVLLAALVVVVLGSLVGEHLGIRDALGRWWFWLGNQGGEYLDLGRLWQILLAVGLVFWLFLMFRALRPAMRDPERGTLASLFLYSAVAIPIFYLPALFYGAHTNFAVIDHWRFWIIHLWVEGFFELFATVLVAVMFVQLGVVSTTTATRVVYLDAILYLAGGIVGTAHHWYFTGEPAVAMALGACFSALEVVPLTLLTLDAWDFVKLSRARCTECGEELAAGQRWSIYFLMAVGVWNFVGAGVFGFLINLPIVSYFQVGTLLTPNHGHAAMFGVFGMLALAVVVFGLNRMRTGAAWKKTERLLRVGFWGLNVGLLLMIVLDLFPGGLLQLWDSVQHGYWHARRLAYLESGTFHTLEWVRIGGDMVFLIVGIVPMVIATLTVVLSRTHAPEANLPEEV